MRFLLLLLAFVALAAEAAAPVLSVSYSRITGTAPLGVIVDATATTDADTTKPFHDLFYTHTFGDNAAGLWANGANTSRSKNFATGAIAGHVYETAGTYTITTTVSDGTTLVRTTQSITVSDPDTTYASTATVCFFNTSVGTGCPSGATQTASSDWDAAIASCAGATKRCLFKRGDTFTASTDSVVTNAGPTTIGAYGSGALPIVSLPSGVNNRGLYFNSSAVDDWRIMDLNFVGGANAADTSQVALFSGNSESKITVLRVTIQSTGGNGLNWDPTGNLGCTYCIIQDSTFSTNATGYTLEATLFSSAVLGNSITGTVTGTAFGPVRVQQVQKTVFASNTVADANAGQAVFSLRAQVHSTTAEDTFYVIVSDNKMSTYAGNESDLLFNIQAASDERIYDVIVERNWFRELYTGADTGGSNMLKTVAARTTVRNNLFDMSAATTSQTWGVYFVLPGGGTPVPDAGAAYNNTFWSGSATMPYYGVVIGTSVTNTNVRNNLCWFDLGSGTDPTSCVGDFGTSTTHPVQPTAGGNSSNAQTTGTDPSFDGPTSTPIGFRIGTGSYASNTGVAIYPGSNDDFFNCDDTTSNERLGAFVPRTRATCRGAAGP